MNAVEPATAAVDLVLAALPRRFHADKVLQDDAGLADIGLELGVRRLVALGTNVLRRLEAIERAHIDDVGIGHVGSPMRQPPALLTAYRIPPHPLSFDAGDTSARTGAGLSGRRRIKRTRRSPHLRAGHRSSH
jgi:hypothetical protein